MPLPPLSGLNPDDTYPRHWTYREAFGERAYAD